MQRKRKQRRQDSLAWKRLIDTILAQTPNYIVKYPLKEQQLLNEFLNVLKAHHVDEISSRKRFSTLLAKYIQERRGTNEYLEIPFLWFSVYYFDRARLLLRVADFFAKDFYGYLAKQLRSFFQLVQNGTSLSDEDAWERLQYECSNIRVPLSAEELQILKSVYSLILENEFHALNPSRTKASIKNRKGLANFFKLLETKWYLLFHPPAFGLERLYFHFQLSEKTSLAEIINFQNSQNTVLCSSDVYIIKGFSNSYIGTLCVPTRQLNPLKNYLKQCVIEGKIILQELKRVEMLRRSASLALYRENKGWGSLSFTKWRHLTERLRSIRQRRRRASLESFHITPPFDLTWQYQHHSRPSQIIKLYCEIPEEFSFDELPNQPTKEQQRKTLTKTDISLLKELIRKQVVHIGFRSDQLWYEWALDAYWVKIPQITEDQLNHLLQWLPFCELYFTSREIHMRVRIPNDWVQRIKEGLNWVIMSIIRPHYPMNLRYNYYDNDSLQWLIPSVLQSNR
ncbi:MAG: hypothetical protein ACFE8U_03120 [Candidatus Hermodarchaeota archaeon]